MDTHHQNDTSAPLSSTSSREVTYTDHRASSIEYYDPRTELVAEAPTEGARTRENYGSVSYQSTEPPLPPVLTDSMSSSSYIPSSAHIPSLASIPCPTSPSTSSSIPTLAPTSMLAPAPTSAPVPTPVPTDPPPHSEYAFLSVPPPPLVERRSSRDKKYAVDAGVRLAGEGVRSMRHSSQSLSDDLHAPDSDVVTLPPPYEEYA